MCNVYLTRNLLNKFQTVLTFAIDINIGMYTLFIIHMYFTRTIKQRIAFSHGELGQTIVLPLNPLDLVDVILLHHIYLFLKGIVRLFPFL